MSVRHGLLAVLNRRSMHGYELRKELVDGLGPEWNVNYGQIYSTLERLVRDGLCVQSETVSVVDAPDRKLYTVTPAGRAELRSWFLTPTSLWKKISMGTSFVCSAGSAGCSTSLPLCHRAPRSRTTAPGSS